MDTARQHATAATAVDPAPGLVDELDAAIRGRTCEELTAAGAEYLAEDAAALEKVILG